MIPFATVSTRAKLERELTDARAEYFDLADDPCWHAVEAERIAAEALKAASKADRPARKADLAKAKYQGLLLGDRSI